MSFLRHQLQQVARTINLSFPWKISFVNPNIINNYQRYNDAIVDFTKQRDINYEHINRRERFSLIKKLFSLLTMSVYVGSTCKRIHDNDILPPVNALIETKPEEEPKPEEHTSKIHEKKRRPSFSKRTVIEYENRLRNYSAPEKIFRYFATICVVSEKGTEILMTPEDFLRSIYPGKKQPRQLGLDRFRRINRNEMNQMDFNLKDNSVFYKLGSHGLITYPDYLFLMTLLTTPSRHFEIAFKMFDENGDGVLSATEFEGVAVLTRQSATFAATGQDLHRKGIPQSLLNYFFGNDLNGKLNVIDFLKFQKDLKKEIITMEFESKPCNEKGQISEDDFAELLIAYAGYSVKQKDCKLRRVHKHFLQSQRGISKKEYLDFWELLNNLSDVEMALSFYHLVGASVDKETFHHVAKAVLKVELSEHVVNVAFRLFDENNDDQLDRSEFVDVMKRRLYRGMQQKRGTNFKQIMAALKKCALERRSYDF